MASATTQLYNEEKLEHCCQRLEQLSAKVDRLMNFESAGQGGTSRPSRPSPNAAPVEVLATTEPQTTLSDTHYDRLEAILIEKIQTYIQNGMRRISFVLTCQLFFFLGYDICFHQNGNTGCVSAVRHRENWERDRGMFRKDERRKTVFAY